MYLTVKQQLKHLSKLDYRALAELCHYAKNLSNQATYNIRQHFFETEEYLNYESNYKMLKSSENYKALNSKLIILIIFAGFLIPQAKDTQTGINGDRPNSTKVTT